MINRSFQCSLLPARYSCFMPPDEGSQCLSAADAHGDDAILQATPLQILRGAQCQNGAGCSERVAKCDGPAVGIGLLWIKLRITDDSHRLRCECFVELNGPDV